MNTRRRLLSWLGIGAAAGAAGGVPMALAAPGSGSLWIEEVDGKVAVKGRTADGRDFVVMRFDRTFLDAPELVGLELRDAGSLPASNATYTGVHISFTKDRPTAGVPASVLDV